MDWVALSCLGVGDGGGFLVVCCVVLRCGLASDLPHGDVYTGCYWHADYGGWMHAIGMEECYVAGLMESMGECYGYVIYGGCNMDVSMMGMK